MRPSPADIVHKYPQFYWNSVAPYIQSAIRYLNVTANGRQWVANLYSNVFRAERDFVLGGPQQWPRKTVTVSPASRDGR